MNGKRFLALGLIGIVPILAQPQKQAFETFGIKRLAFVTGPVSFFALQEDIFVLDSLKSKPRRLAEGIAVVWSPDGQRIAYCAHEGWGTKHIVLGQLQVINADGSGHAQLTNEPGGACPVDWAPGGKRISSRPGIVVLDNDATGVASIVRGVGGQWSPDGSKLAFWRPGSVQSGGSIWIANGDGAQPRKVIDDNSLVIWLCWSPDAESILFSSRRENKQRSEIFRVKLDGTHLETIAADKKLSFTHPLISPDGRYLVVDAQDGGSQESAIMLLNLADHTRTVLAHGHRPSIVWDQR